MTILTNAKFTITLERKKKNSKIDYTIITENTKGNTAPSEGAIEERAVSKHLHKEVYEKSFLT